MAYYTGIATSYDDIHAALVSACQTNGWTWADGILSKGVLHVKPVVVPRTSSRYIAGISIQGGTGKTGGTLLQPSRATPKLSAVNDAATISWPVEYYLHVFTNPDEVYLVVRYNLDWFMWLSFGQSTVPGITGTGQWLAASAALYCPSTAVVAPLLLYSSYSLGYAATVSGYQETGTTSGGFFLNNDDGFSTSYPETYFNSLHTGITSTHEGWSHGVDGTTSWQSAGGVDAGAFMSQLAIRALSMWSQESVLLPFNIYAGLGSWKVALVCQPKNIRYCDVRNYEPGQIVTLGADKWKIFPFIKKDATATGSTVTGSTGVTGWAIRYDGP